MHDAAHREKVLFIGIGMFKMERKKDTIQALSQPRHPSLLSEKSDKKSIIQFIQLNDQWYLFYKKTKDINLSPFNGSYSPGIP